MTTHPKLNWGEALQIKNKLEECEKKLLLLEKTEYLHDAITCLKTFTSEELTLINSPLLNALHSNCQNPDLALVRIVDANRVDALQFVLNRAYYSPEQLSEAFFTSCEVGADQLITYFFDHGVSPFYEKESVLSASALSNNPDIIKLVQSKFPDSDKFLLDALRNAIEYECERSVEYLLPLIDVNTIPEAFLTLACEHNTSNNITKALLDKGLSVNSNKGVCIRTAVESDDLEWSRELLKRGASSRDFLDALHEYHSGFNGVWVATIWRDLFKYDGRWLERVIEDAQNEETDSIV